MRDALADVFLPADTPDSYGYRQGVVTDDSPLEVNLIGQSGLSAALLRPYVAPALPAVGHIVLVLQTKTDMIILGQIESGG